MDYLQDQNYKFIEGDTNLQTKSKEEFMKQLFFKKLITKFKIGTPAKIQTFLLDSDSNSYYLDSLNPPESSQGQCKLSEFYKFEKNEYYDETSSNSYVKGECKTVKHEFNQYDEICNSKDKVTLNINGNTTNLEFPIKVIKNHDESVPGLIGMAINDTMSRDLRSFLSELKLKNLIADYFWFFDFDEFSPFEKKTKRKICHWRFTS